MFNKNLFEHLQELRREGLLNQLGLVRYNEKEFKFRFNGWTVQSYLSETQNGKKVPADEIYNWITAERFRNSPRIIFEGSDFQGNEIHGYIDQDTFARVMDLPHGGILMPVINAALTTLKTENPIRIKITMRWTNNYLQLDTRL